RPAPPATAATPAGPSPSTTASGRPPIALSTATFSGHGRARSSRVSTRINPEANERAPVCGPTTPQRPPPPGSGGWERGGSGGWERGGGVGGGRVRGVREGPG